jgi:hypothetical protein
MKSLHHFFDGHTQSLSQRALRYSLLSLWRFHNSIYFAYMFLPKWLIFYLTSLPQNKLLRSFAFTSSRIVLREHFCTLKYIPIQQGTRVCLHGSQARVKSTNPGPNHHLHNNKILKILTPFFAVFFSQNINRYTWIYTSRKIKSLRLNESHITQAQFQELFSVSHVSTWTSVEIETCNLQAESIGAPSVKEIGWYHASYKMS